MWVYKLMKIEMQIMKMPDDVGMVLSEFDARLFTSVDTLKAFYGIENFTNLDWMIKREELTIQETNNKHLNDWMGK